MVAITSVLAFALVATGKVCARSEDNVQTSTTLGGPHGTPFDDLAIVKDEHHRLRRITISPCEELTPLTYLKFEYSISTARNAPITHSSEHGILHAGKSKVLELSDTEHVTSYKGFNNKVSTGLRYKTRLGAIGFKTNLGHEIACGTSQRGRDAQEVQAGDKRAFLYFSGAAGAVIDNLTGHTIPVADYF